MNNFTQMVEIGNGQEIALQVLRFDLHRSAKGRAIRRRLIRNVQTVGSRVKGSWRHHFVRRLGIEELARLHSELWNVVVQDSIELPGGDSDNF